MLEPAARRYRVRPSWRLLGCALLGLIWGGKTTSLVVRYYGSSIESASGEVGLWAVGIAIAVSMTTALGILIDWAWWSEETEAAEAKPAKAESVKSPPLAE